MALLYHSGDDPERWRTAFRECAPELELRVWPDIGEASDITAAMVFNPPHGVLASLPNLKLIISRGFGVDHLFTDPALPPHVPIVRLVDPSAICQMTQYVVLATLRYHRRMDEIEDAWRRGEWRKVPPPDTAKTVVGVLGLGVLGRDAAEKLASLGFSVRGWSRTEKEIPGITCFHAAQGLGPFLGECRIVICLLALTPETESILCAETFAGLPAGAFVINAGRGRHLVEDDLIAALDSGHLGGATLDVFRVEPLATEHPFWRHPKVRITPHIAADGIARTAAPIAAENIRRADAGEPLLHQVDPARGH